VTGELVGSLYRSHTKDEVEQAQASMKDLLAGESDNIGDMVKAGYSESEVSAYLEYKLKSGGYQDEIDQLRQNGVDLARFSAGLVGMLAGADAAGVNLAALTGENAAENNALFMLAIPYVITAISIGITAYEIYDPPLYQEIEKAGGDVAAAREVLAGRLQEWYDEGGLLLAIIESAFPTLKVAGKTVDQIKEALEKLGGNPLEPLSSAMAGVSPTLANMVDAKVQSSVAKGELPEGAGVPSSLPRNLSVNSLDNLSDAAINPSVLRDSLFPYVRGGNTKDISVAAASIEIEGQAQYLLSVSGRSWKENAPGTVKIDGVEYQVIRYDSGAVSNVVNGPNGSTNYNHAEQKIMSYLQETYSGQQARVSVGVQNISVSNPGMCSGCAITSNRFAENNPIFDIRFFEGGSGFNP
jgi:hypothetical protein